MQDIVIRGGRVVDGTGAPARHADVAIKDGIITAVGKIEGEAHRAIDADGALVTPGFIECVVDPVNQVNTGCISANRGR